MTIGMALLAQTEGSIQLGQVHLLTSAFGGQQESKVSRDMSKNSKDCCRRHLSNIPRCTDVATEVCCFAPCECCSMGLLKCALKFRKKGIK